MSHEITLRANGFSEMAFVGETPWHGLGQNLQQGASLETWQQAAGMDWRVQRGKVRYAIDRIDGMDAIPTSAIQTWDDRHVLFRSDTKAPLGVVSERYQVVQPREVLEFFAHVADENRLTLETAGTLRGGAQYWALAKTGMNFTLGGVDRVESYVLLATSADGSLATTAQFTSVRVVCANTLGMALRADRKDAIRIKHSTKFNAQQVRIDLGLAGDAWQEFEAKAVKLAVKPLTKGNAVNILIDAIGDRAKFEADRKAMTLAAALESQPNYRGMARIMELFQGDARGSQAATADGTAWGLVNAATEYYDHENGRGVDTRLASAWFGPNAQRKQAIAERALEYVPA